MTRTILPVAIMLLLSPPAQATSLLIVQSGGPRAARVHAAVFGQLQAARQLDVTMARGRRASLIQRCLKRQGCLQRMGPRLAVDLMLVSHVRSRGGRFTASFTLFSARTGARLAHDRVAARGRRAGQQLTRSVERLLRDQLPSTPAPALARTQGSVSRASGDAVVQVVDTE